MQSIGLIKASLNNYTVFITGGGSGIGYSTAILFAKMNANVAVNFLIDDCNFVTPKKYLPSSWS